MRYLLLAFCGLLCRAQQELAPDVILLARIKTHMAENLAHLPNYTCTQTIERSQRRAPTRRFEIIDTVRLEVALVEGTEMYGWPGAKRIDESDITRLVGGTIGNGAFAIMARNLFVTDSARFKYAGETVVEGRRAARFDYVVPLLTSGYVLRVPPLEAKVGHHGSVWADPESFDLLRMEVFADDIPAYLGLSASTDLMDYARTEIGGSSFLLPAGSRMMMTQLNGTESRNVTRFHSCRQFTGESKLSFGDPPPDAPLPPKPASVTNLQLPDDFVADIALQTPIDSASSAVGDAVLAQVRSAIKQGGQVIVPKGAMISGRITRLERAGDLYVLDIDFASIEFANGQADLLARNNTLTLNQGGKGISVRLVAPPRPNIGHIAVPVTHLKLDKSSFLVLRSRLLKSESNDSIRP